jgi:hypothetical protein
VVMTYRLVCCGDDLHRLVCGGNDLQTSLWW